METATLDFEPEAAEAPAEKRKFPRADAIAVARELVVALAGVCEEGRIIVAGSLRRMKREVGDVEIVYVSQTAPGAPENLFEVAPRVPIADAVIDALLARGVLAKRPNAKGGTAWGRLNKLAVHVASGIPVDLFSTSPGSFWNYVVCRTGGKESNVAICQAARARGWKWNPYGEGFSRPKGLEREVHPVESERAVFEFVGLPFLPPEERR